MMDFSSEEEEFTGRVGNHTLPIPKLGLCLLALILLVIIFNPSEVSILTGSRAGLGQQNLTVTKKEKGRM